MDDRGWSALKTVYMDGWRIEHRDLSKWMDNKRQSTLKSIQANELEDGVF